MRHADFLAIGVAVRRAEIEPRQDGVLPCPGLVGAAFQADAALGDIELKGLAAGQVFQRDVDFSAMRRQAIGDGLFPALRHGKQRIGLGLRQVDHGRLHGPVTPGHRTIK